MPLCTHSLTYSFSRSLTYSFSRQLMHMLAQYVHTLEGDRRMLRAQVKRLASENNWLRKELGEHQQLLQETEIQLARSKEERQQLEFTTRNQKVGGRGGEKYCCVWGERSV